MKTTEPIDSFSIWDSYWDIGTCLCTAVGCECIPINKIPVFSFIKANYSYTGDYTWRAVLCQE
jgi:hypothetical protein